MTPLSPPYEVELDFYLAPDNAQERNPENPYGPDLDNLAKPVLDALKPLLVPDDGAVTALRLTKRRVTTSGPSGVAVRIRCGDATAGSR